MRGTMRTLKESVRDEMEAAVERVAAGVAQTFGVKIDVEQIADGRDGEHPGGARPRRRGGSGGGHPAAARHGTRDDR